MAFFAIFAKKQAAFSASAKEKRGFFSPLFGDFILGYTILYCKISLVWKQTAIPQNAALQGAKEVFAYFACRPSKSTPSWVPQS